MDLEKIDHQPNDVLQKIYRAYSKDEALAVLIAETRALQYELGIRKSENAELKAYLTKEKQDWGKDEYVKTIKDKLKKTQEQNAPLKREVDYWRTKYFNEISKKYEPEVNKKSEPNY